MPAQKGLRPYDQAASTRIRQDPRQRGKQHTIGWPQARASLLPAKYGQLMPQHEQLDVLGELAAPAADQQPQQRRESEIGERKEHAADASTAS
jgi:hypothetical protein